MSIDPLTQVSTRWTPQSEPVPGRTDQVANSAGGHVFGIDKWSRLNRFLILGTVGGTYYSSEQKLTKDNAAIVFECIAEDHSRTITTIVDVSTAGRAPKPNPAIFALAAAAGSDDPKARAMALSHLPVVCRTGTHLFTFVGYVEQFRGWGRGLRTAVGKWYADKTPRAVAYQATKYAQRNGWSHRDLLRLAKPKPDRGSDMDGVFGAVVGKPQNVAGEGSEYFRAVEMMKTINSPTKAIELLQVHNMPWEVLPSHMLRDPAIWEALVPSMGLTALIRNLGRMTDIGFIKSFSAGSAAVCARLASADDILKSRVHPLQILTAEAVYRRGAGLKGSLTWTPDPNVLDVLDRAFYKSFGNIEPTGKQTLTALDVSASMGWGNLAGSPLTPREASVALALLSLHVEPSATTMAFADNFVHLPLQKNTPLGEAVEMTSRLRMSRTDCAVPMLWALAQGVQVDTFVIYTDNETWSGKVHPFQALNRYREKMGIDAKLVVAGMTSTGFSIADPTDKGMLDVVGFDTATPNIIADFSRGLV